jgi:signal transduction histidine kinase
MVTMSDDEPMLHGPARGVGWLRQLFLDTGYALLGFAVSLLFFVVVVTGLSLSVGLAIIVGGVLLLPLTLLVSRGQAAFERRTLRSMLGLPAPTPTYLRAEPGAGFWTRVLTPVRDPQSWLDALWSLIGLVTGTAAFSIVVTWWAAVAGGLSYWFWSGYLPSDPENEGLAGLLGLGDGRAAESLTNLVIGVIALVTLPFACRLAALMHGRLAQIVLCSRAELQHRVDRAEETRDATRAAEAASLRRLERDIHDGPQQRLVRLSMDLGRARMRLGEDTSGAGELIDDAVEHARQAVAELRALSRGVAPPLLVDRGLRAAIEEMITHAAVPIEAHLDLPAGPGALPLHVETAVYFAVAEALTNVAKHSQATSARVSVTAAGGTVRAVVADDGVGGAQLAKGLGLAGLRQRLEAVDGTLEVTSEADAGTVVVATVPIELGASH